MQGKVEICGVNTSKLPVLKAGETRALLEKARAGDLEARQALNRAYELRGDKWIMLFSDCIPALLLNSLQPPLRPRHVIAPELTVLREYDAAHDTQYFDTLRVFLLEERNIPRASERLIIHRTTLLYRLRKIESLVTLNLDDPWRRLYLMLSLKILDGTQA